MDRALTKGDIGRFVDGNYATCLNSTFPVSGGATDSY